MKVDMQMLGPTARLYLEGSFSYSAHQNFRNSCECAMANADIHKLEVDLDKVTDMDSFALGMLIMLKSRAQKLNKRIAFINSHGFVAEVLHTAKLHTLFSEASHVPE